MRMLRRICISSSKLVVFLLLFCARMGVSSAKIHGGNPANDLVDLVNGKRAASKLPALRNSRGLGCMALQYIAECMATTTSCTGGDTVMVACQPPEAHITEVYAANCGVELPTVDVISGRLLACRRGRDGPGPEDINATALAVIRGKEHTQVGAGFDRRGPLSFWCLLFSSGSANSTFLLEAGGKGISQRETHGCFSAPDRASCSAATPPPPPRPIFTVAAAALLLFRGCTGLV